MSKLKKEHTSRGFSLYEFKERNGSLCSLQKSSIATENCIWFGPNESQITIGYPWKTYTEQQIKEIFGGKDIVSNSRMHLTQKQVQELLPILQRFAQTGEI